MRWLTRFLRGREGAARDPLRPAGHSRFRAGQVWRYHSRQGEDASRAIVGRVEETAAGEVIVHVQLAGLDLRNPAAPAGHSSTIHHLPIAEVQMAKSVLEFVSEEGGLDDFDEGYETCRDAYLTGKGGVFGLPLAEIVDVMEQTMTRGRPPGA